MATASQIARLRRLVADVDQPYSFTDEELSDLIDENKNNLDHAAYEVWRQKAASLSSALDISESGSSRKLSDLYKNALTQANFYKPTQAETSPEMSGPFTAPIVRP